MVERTLGKGEVASPILAGGTISLVLTGFYPVDNFFFTPYPSLGICANPRPYCKNSDMTQQHAMMMQEPSSPIHFDWHSAQQRLRTVLGDATYQSWLSQLEFHELTGGVMILSAPSRFIKDWVLTNCLSVLEQTFRALDPSILKVDVIVSADVKSKQVGIHTGEAKDALDAPAQAQSSSREYEAEWKEGDREFVGSVLDPRFTFENFVVGKPNELAYAAARRVAESDEVTFNPLFLYGGVGLGKTHLMHAIAWHIKRLRPNRKVIYLSAEKFMYQFIRALRFKDTVAFKEQFRSVDVLMIDDVQFISGKDSTQEEFFHTFNALVDQNRQIIVSADKSPSDLEGMEERMKSRLGWGLVADVHPTTYELRLGILQAKAEKIGVAVPPQVIEFLAHKITSNVRELEGALTRIVAYATLVGRSITVEMTQDALRDLLRANDRQITIEHIQKKVAEHFNVRIADMHSSRRLRNVARPRQVAMFLVKTLTTHSLPEIGRKFGGRDHTTVMHAVKKVEELMVEDATFREDIELLKRMLQS